MKKFVVSLLATITLCPIWAWTMPTAKTAKVLGGVASVGALASVLYRNNDDLYTPSPKSLSGKTIFITGGTTGLGLESAQRLAIGGAKIIISARDDRKGEMALQKIRSYCRMKNVENDSIEYRVLDLDDLESIKQTVPTWDIDKIDVLINNAGIMALPERELTVDGIERQMQSNHLGHFVLTALLAPKLSSTARIINVSSTAHTMVRTLDFEYMWQGQPNYQPWKSYGHSKLANILFTQELQRRNHEWLVSTLHPGVVGTDLGRYLFGDTSNNPLFSVLGGLASRFLKTPAQGATTQIWLAASDEAHKPNGRYFIDCRSRPLSSAATDPVAAERLWRESEQKAGITFDAATLKTITRS